MQALKVDYLLLFKLEELHFLLIIIWPNFKFNYRKNRAKIEFLKCFQINAINLFWFFQKYLKLLYVVWSSIISKGKHTKGHWDLQRYYTKRRIKEAIGSIESRISLLCHSRICFIHERRNLILKNWNQAKCQWICSIC